MNVNPSTTVMLSVERSIPRGIRPLRGTLRSTLRVTCSLGATILLGACGGAAAPSSAPAASAPAASAKPAASASAEAIPTAKPGTITIAIVGGSPSFLPIWIGVDNGLFDKYGAPVQLVTTTAPPAMAALLNGDVHVAMDGGAMIGADPSGSKLAFIGGLQNAFNQFVVAAKPGINSLAELKGHTVGSASPGSAATIAFEVMLKAAGLDPKTDVKWAYLGTPAAQYAALTAGNIDAGVNAWPYNVLARQGGFKPLADGKQMKIPGTSLTLGVTRQWVKANPKLVDGFLRAVTESAHIANTDKSKVMPAMTKHALVPVSDQAVLDEAYERFSGTFPEPPYITTEAVQEAINDEPNPAVKSHKPEDYIDNAPLDALVASGFTKQFG
ncbi:MAG TPA: ABC transporter substrate-binding protein [Chloroflexota bacterium]